jgi:antitoxin Phd
MAIPLKNPVGRLAQTFQVSASDAKNSFGSILDRVTREGAVAITKHDKPVAMLVSIDAYRALVPPPEESLKNLAAEFDAVYQRMQSPGAADAMQKAFAMTPAQLGRAAVLESAASRKPQGKPPKRGRG